MAPYKVISNKKQIQNNKNRIGTAPKKTQLIPIVSTLGLVCTKTCPQQCLNVHFSNITAKHLKQVMPWERPNRLFLDVSRIFYY